MKRQDREQHTEMTQFLNFFNAWGRGRFNPCCKLRFGLPTPKMCFADYYDDVSGGAKRNRNEIREKIKTDYKYLPKKVI